MIFHLFIRTSKVKIISMDCLHAAHTILRMSGTRRMLQFLNQKFYQWFQALLKAILNFYSKEEEKTFSVTRLLRFCGFLFYCSGDSSCFHFQLKPVLKSDQNITISSNAYHPPTHIPSKQKDHKTIIML